MYKLGAEKLGMYDTIGIKHDGIKSYWDLKGVIFFPFFFSPLEGLLSNVSTYMYVYDRDLGIANEVTAESTSLGSWVCSTTYMYLPHLFQLSPPVSMNYTSNQSPCLRTKPQ